MEISDDYTETQFLKKNSHWSRKGETTEQHGQTSKPLKLRDVMVDPNSNRIGIRVRRHLERLKRPQPRGCRGKAV